MAHSTFCLRPSSNLDLVYVYYIYKEECIEDAKLLFNRGHMLYNWQIAIEKKDLQPYTQDASNIVGKASLFELNENPPTFLSVERVGYPYGIFEQQISRSPHLSSRPADHQISNTALQQNSRSAAPDQQISRSVNQQLSISADPQMSR